MATRLLGAGGSAYHTARRSIHSCSIPAACPSTHTCCTYPPCAGYRLIVCDRSQEAVERLQAAGAKAAPTPAALASTPGLPAAAAPAARQPHTLPPRSPLPCPWTRTPLACPQACLPLCPCCPPRSTCGRRTWALMACCHCRRASCTHTCWWTAAPLTQSPRARCGGNLDVGIALQLLPRLHAERALLRSRDNNPAPLLACTGGRRRVPDLAAPARRRGARRAAPPGEPAAALLLGNTCLAGRAPAPCLHSCLHGSIHPAPPADDD